MRASCDMYGKFLLDSVLSAVVGAALLKMFEVVGAVVIGTFRYVILIVLVLVLGRSGLHAVPAWLCVHESPCSLNETVYTCSIRMS